MIWTIALLLLGNPELAGPAVSFNDHAPPTTLAAGAAMDQQQLADVLLGRGHAAVETATIGPQGMQAPLPPGAATDTDAEVRFVPTAAPNAGFCRRVVATLTMSPASRDVASREALYRPTAIRARTEYRWAGRSGNAKGCAAPRATFFPADGELAGEQLDLVRLVANTSERARRGRRASFPVTVDDRMGPQMIAFEAGQPASAPHAKHWTVYTDGTKALAAVPASDVFAAYPNRRSYADPFSEAELARIKGAGVVPWTVRTSEWTVGVEMRDDRIVAMRMVRAVPAPF